MHLPESQCAGIQSRISDSALQNQSVTPASLRQISLNTLCQTVVQTLPDDLKELLNTDCMFSNPLKEKKVPDSKFFNHMIDQGAITPENREPIENSYREALRQQYLGNLPEANRHKKLGHQQLLAAVIQAGQPGFDGFIRALNVTNQVFLANALQQAVQGEPFPALLPCQRVLLTLPDELKELLNSTVLTDCESSDRETTDEHEWHIDHLYLQAKVHLFHEKAIEANRLKKMGHEKLLATVIQAGQRGFDAFIRALNATNQVFLANALQQAVKGEPFPTLLPCQRVLLTLPDEHKDLLIYTIASIIDLMFYQGVITDENRKSIRFHYREAIIKQSKGKHTEAKFYKKLGHEQLLATVIQAGQPGFDAFIWALNANEQVLLANVLQQAVKGEPFPTLLPCQRVLLTFSDMLEEQLNPSFIFIFHMHYQGLITDFFYEIYIKRFYKPAEEEQARGNLPEAKKIKKAGNKQLLFNVTQAGQLGFDEFIRALNVTKQWNIANQLTELVQLEKYSPSSLFNLCNTQIQRCLNPFDSDFKSKVNKLPLPPHLESMIISSSS